MAERCCVVVGAGRVAGGFVSPLLRAAGWRVVLVCRNAQVRDAVNKHRGVFLRVAGDLEDRWFDGITAMGLDEPGLCRTLRDADLIATAVGPSSLTAAGRWLGPLLADRLESASTPINLVLFENSRRAQELLTLGMLHERPGMATHIGRKLGVGGAAVWCTVSRRDLTPEWARFTSDRTTECSVDAMALLTDAAPMDGSVPGLCPVRSFDDRITEKLWLFNAGHAAAAYLGWHAGCSTMSEALDRPEIRRATVAAIGEAQRGFDAHLATRPGSVAVPRRSIEELIHHYADPGLEDPVTRVAREPRRKLAIDDRVVGPAIACLAAGGAPLALADVAAAALAFCTPDDQQSVDLQREIDLVGAREVFATISSLDPGDDFVDLTIERHAAFAATGAVQ